MKQLQNRKNGRGDVQELQETRSCHFLQKVSSEDLHKLYPTNIRQSSFSEMLVEKRRSKLLLWL